MIRFKKGVSLKDMKPQIGVAMRVAEAVYGNEDRTLWVTSVNDGKHMDRSKHYTGEAFDCRTWNLDDPKITACVISGILGDEFDVIYEVDEKNEENNHIHIEFDPKN